MKKTPVLIGVLVILVVAFLWIRRSGSAGAGSGEDAVPATPAQAATQVEQVFQEAQPEIKQAATTAADAMRKGDYERAVVSLTVVRQQENLTLQQGMAIHNSMVNLESQLIRAIENGDENAKRAYELLRKSKQN